LRFLATERVRTQADCGYGFGSEYTRTVGVACTSVRLRIQMMQPFAQAGLIPAVLLAVCFFSPVAVGLSIAGGHGSARENEMGLDGHVRVDPGEDFDDAGLFGPYEGGPFDGEPDTHAYDFEAHGARLQRVNFPRGSRVALVLRGASFRNHREKDKACMYSYDHTVAGDDTRAFGLQENATKSLVENVIEPLEQAGNTVDVILTDHECVWTNTVAVWIGDSTEHPRVKQITTQSMKEGQGDQRDNLLFALDALANYTGGKRKVALEYAYVFIVRHDTAWTKPMSEWPDADFTKVLFPYHCPYKGSHDLFTLMPATRFESYYETIFSRECFYGNDGHLCLKAMGNKLGFSYVGVAMRYEEKTKFEPFTFWHTYGRPRQTC